ncbi:hypothetical protein QCA22_004996 [Salmonella enterica]|nr:hypothetical protein [Salmonella enterica]EKS5830128.1 hypothetical protein [Salmonella enterica]EKS5881049.1 hypothetical protein [Salmonella enterica]
MGRSNSIAEQQKSNEAFQKYVTEMQSDMTKRLSDVKSSINEMIEEHYKKYPDKNELMVGEYTHLATLSEWSLDAVNKIIDSCKKSLFGETPPPEGSEIDKSLSSSAIQALKARELYIFNEAFTIINGILASFKNTTSTSVELKTDAKPVAPGIMLFISVMENSFSRSDFFNNELIVQNAYYFKVCYSLKEGESVSKISDLQAYEDQKQSYRNQLIKIDDVISSLEVTNKDYLVTFQKYSNIAEMLNKQLKIISDKIHELASGEYKKISSRINSSDSDVVNIVTRIKEKRDQAFKKL